MIFPIIHQTDNAPTPPTDTTLSALSELYRADARPWVVAYSGGKDSTLLLQLVIEFLQKLQSHSKPVFILSTDTRVESPNVARYVTNTLTRIETWSQNNAIPISVHLEQPTPEESFWGKLIGKGYPPPSRWFRWCTSNMKIKPARRVVDKITRQHGSVILLLGSRLSESPQRRIQMTGREINARGLNPHHEIPNAWVATPISGWETDDVWEYLATTPPPWGGDHATLIRLYRQANGGECPVVLDLDTPSCGGSRFGCWTCTVVKEDRSMQGFIQTGDEQLSPLNEFRNKLVTYRDAPGMCSRVKRDGTPGPAPLPRMRAGGCWTRCWHWKNKPGSTSFPMKNWLPYRPNGPKTSIFPKARSTSPDSMGEIQPWELLAVMPAPLKKTPCWNN